MVAREACTEWMGNNDNVNDTCVWGMPYAVRYSVVVFYILIRQLYISTKKCSLSFDSLTLDASFLPTLFLWLYSVYCVCVRAIDDKIITRHRASRFVSDKSAISRSSYLRHTFVHAATICMPKQTKHNNHTIGIYCGGTKARSTSHRTSDVAVYLMIARKQKSN